jgi:hypothetical protein
MKNRVYAERATLTINGVEVPFTELNYSKGSDAAFGSSNRMTRRKAAAQARRKRGKTRGFRHDK